MDLDARPRSTRAVVYYDADDLRLEEVPLPSLGEGELLVRIRACGLCPGEAMGWYMRKKAPLVPGHEPVADVVAAGARVEGFRPGTRVFVHHHAPCMRCRACRRGDHVQCATWRPRRLLPGALAEFAVVQAPAVQADTLAVPPDMNDEVATFVEPLACVVKSLRRAGLRAGDRVLVLGLGVMGLLHLLLARRWGAETVIGVDRVTSRLARAQALGADAVVDVDRVWPPDAVRAATGGDGADIVVVGPGSVEAIQLGMECVAPGGTLVLFTPTPPEVAWPVNVHDMYFKEVRVVPSYSAGPVETREALDLLAGGLPVASLVTHRFSLQQVSEGYRLVAEAKEALKVVIVP
ncbi:MAG: zinc-binding dehydrogenase [Armatimonadetes bacterium]|nr:zinc-binding dehydrogenase [Armatimonadota bacterium]